MQLKNVQICNIGAIEEIPGFGEKALVRVPSEIRNKLNERARFIGMDSVGIEIRFVTDAPNVDVYVSALKPEFGENGTVKIYRGNFLYQSIVIEPGVVKNFRLNQPPAFNSANEKMLDNGGFASNVWRIVCDRSTYIIHGINTHGHEIREPNKEELPKLNWLAYGSSITNSHLDGYVHIAAARIRAQVQNMGFSGSCHIEKELVDYMLDEREFDFITCELGVNMRGIYSPEEFKERAEYLINRISNLEKPALIITPYPNSATLEYTSKANNITENENAYSDILVDLVKQANSDKIKLIHGNQILDDVNGLSGDLIHPSNYGHAVMGMNLYNVIKDFLK